MSTFEEQFKKAISNITLAPEERAAIRATLLAEMAAAPLPNASAATVRSSYSLLLIRNRLKKTMPIALLIALLMSGGVSYAAEGATPGDTLYPIKVHVNEGVRGVLAVSDSAKAKLEVDLADRRLVEAEQLKSEDRLDATTTAALRAEFVSHRGRADEHLKAMQDGNKQIDATAISADLTLRLSGHHEVLRALGVGEDGDDDNDNDEGDEHTDVVGSSTSSGSEGERGGSRRGGRVMPSGSTTLNLNSDMQFNGADPRGEREEGSESIEHSSNTEIKGERGGDDNDDDEGERHSRQRGGGTAAVTLPIPSVTPAVPTPVVTTTVTSYTLAEVAIHNNAASCYSAISGSVYNLTPFINSHPGGSGTILSLCGRDGTAGFMAQHAGQGKPQSTLASFRLGTLAL
jgi:cytochrome b involved in lipid metabolism